MGLRCGNLARVKGLRWINVSSLRECENIYDKVSIISVNSFHTHSFFIVHIYLLLRIPLDSLYKFEKVFFYRNLINHVNPV